MLPYLLALIVAVAGVALYATAFFFPNLYRKNDLIWSGVALFYGLVLWFCARRLTGAVLLGQTASVALIGWLGFQAFQFRWSQLPSSEQASIADGSTVKQRVDELKATDWKEVAQTTSARVKEVAAGAAGAATGAVAGVAADAAEAKDATASGGSTPVAAVTAFVVKVKGLFQGRKTHGKKYVRPDASQAATTTYEADWDDLGGGSEAKPGQKLEKAIEKAIETTTEQRPNISVSPSPQPNSPANPPADSPSDSVAETAAVAVAAVAVAAETAQATVGESVQEAVETVSGVIETVSETVSETVTEADAEDIDADDIDADDISEAREISEASDGVATVPDLAAGEDDDVSETEDSAEDSAEDPAEDSTEMALTGDAGRSQPEPSDEPLSPEDYSQETHEEEYSQEPPPDTAP
jgi:hypothetical protein